MACEDNISDTNITSFWSLQFVQTFIHIYVAKLRIVFLFSLVKGRQNWRVDKIIRFYIAAAKFNKIIFFTD